MIRGNDTIPAHQNLYRLTIISDVKMMAKDKRLFLSDLDLSGISADLFSAAEQENVNPKYVKAR